MERERLGLLDITALAAGVPAPPVVEEPEGEGVKEGLGVEVPLTEAVAGALPLPTPLLLCTEDLLKEGEALAVGLTDWVPTAEPEEKREGVELALERPVPLTLPLGQALLVGGTGEAVLAGEREDRGEAEAEGLLLVLCVAVLHWETLALVEALPLPLLWPLSVAAPEALAVPHRV